METLEKTGFLDRQFWSTYQLSSSKYSFTDRYDSECYDHRLHSRCPAPHERVPTARGPRLQLRRGFPVCLSSHRCTFAKDPCMGSKLTRVTSRLLDARRARGGGVYSSSSEAAKKKRCRKGCAYRRWTKAQATNYGVTGIRHAGPFVDPSQDHRAVVTDLREASGVGEPHPPAWEGTCHRIGSVTCKQLERSTTTSLGADAHSQTPSNPISNTQTALSWKHQTFSEKVSKIKHMSRCEA